MFAYLYYVVLQSINILLNAIMYNKGLYFKFMQQYLFILVCCENVSDGNPFSYNNINYGLTLTSEFYTVFTCQDSLLLKLLLTSPCQSISNVSIFQNFNSLFSSSPNILRMQPRHRKTCKLQVIIGDVRRAGHWAT